MKGLKKIALCSAVALAPFAANADMKALNDSDMGSVTGQAGVTIDLSADVSIGEIAYEDQGFLAISDVTLGGAEPGDSLDDIRLTIDVAGADQDDLGVEAFGATYLGGAGFDVAGVNEADQEVSDGDLVIALRSQSGAPVDYGLGIGEVSLNKSANSGDLGSFVDSGDKGTVLVSDLNITGLIGPVDIVVQEETNALNVNAYFSADGDLTMPFIGTSLEFELHNRRGESRVVAGDISFAHAQVDIGVAEDYEDMGGTAIGDALRVTVQDFSGDLDLTNIEMGNGVSIGNVYMTDLAVTADMVVYGH